MECLTLYKVVIADDHTIVREGIKRILESCPEIEVIACVDNCIHAYNACKEHHVDLVLLDMVMPECDGVEAARMINALNKNIKILILTSIPDSAKFVEAVKVGISGCILKDSTPEELILAIKSAANGITAYNKSVFDGIIDSIAAEEISDNSLFTDLTPCEYSVLDLVAKGLENKEISKEIFLSESTVRGIVSKLLLKYEVNNRTKLAAFAARNGLG